MAVLEVIKMGNPLLRKISTPVANDTIASARFQNLITDLIATMRLENGAGIAAVQVGVLERVFVMEVANNERYPEKNEFPLQIAINPKIEVLSSAKIPSWEGCLSIPNIRGRLERYQHIKLTAFNSAGEQYALELDGFAAIVAQHELDHLNGKLLIDRMDSMETLTFHEEYKKFWM